MGAAHFSSSHNWTSASTVPTKIDSSQLETNPFKWECAHRPFLLAFLCVMWTTGEKAHQKYHLSIVQGKRLCMKAGNDKNAPAPKRRRG